MRRVMLLGLLALALPMAAFAGTIDIKVINASFEKLPPGGLTHDCEGPNCKFSVGDIFGWTESGGAGQLHPSTTGPKRLFNTFAPNNGDTSAFANAGGTISQAVGTVQEGVIYTLSLEIGHVRDEGFGGSADLLVGNKVVAIATGATPTRGNWSTFTATFTGTAAQVGKPITIQLKAFGPGNQGNFDSVKLTATTVIPEPGTLGMLGTGLIGLAGMARRKLKFWT